MSAFTPTAAVISIGGALLRTIGLTPNRISVSREARFPAHPIAAGIAYQATGVGQETISIEAKTLPHVFGGLDAYAILRAHQEAQSVVPFIRLRGNYLGQSSGLCVVQSLDADEERLHPFDGIGREIDVSIGLLMMPAAAPGIGNLISSFGGLLR